MKWLKTTLLSIVTLCSPYLVNAAGLKSVYTLPCGVNSYTIIPVAAPGATAPYTLYAADGITVIAGPQTSNVFSNITGTIGDNFVVGVINVFNGATLFTTITLNGGTTVLNGRVNCACTLGIPEVCYALLGSDQIAGATYTWTSPSGIIFNQSGLTVPQQPPENGVWTVNASVVVGTCTHVLNNSFVLANCNSAFPVLFNYVRAVSTNCKIMAEWSTAQENNSDRFEIETSEDGNTGWHKVVTVAAAGTSNTNIQYSAEVPTGKAPVVFIRLRQVDKDGHFVYSGILKETVRCKGGNDLLTVQPGIVMQGGIVAFKMESSVLRGKSYIMINDGVGRQHTARIISVNASSNRYDFSTANFVKGIYFVRIVGATGNWQSNTVKFVVQ